MDRISGIRKNIQDEIDAIWRKAYNAGRERTIEEKAKMYDQAEYDLAYQKGLDDAWETANKISKMKEDERRSIFTWLSFETIIRELSVKQVIKKIEAWEQKQKVKKNCLECKYSDDRDVDRCYDCETGYADGFERNADEIRIGDEVTYKDGNEKCVVTRVGNYGKTLMLLNQDGGWMIRVDDVNLVEKTGRHFDQIAEVLEQMKGEQQ